MNNSEDFTPWYVFCLIFFYLGEYRWGRIQQGPRAELVVLTSPLPFQLTPSWFLSAAKERRRNKITEIHIDPPNFPLQPIRPWWLAAPFPFSCFCVPPLQLTYCLWPLLSKENESSQWTSHWRTPFPSSTSNNQWDRRLEGWPNTAARLAGWVWFCTWWTIHAACPDGPPHLPRSGADLLLNVHKSPSWATSHKEGIVCYSCYSRPMPFLWKRP